MTVMEFGQSLRTLLLALVVTGGLYGDSTQWASHMEAARKALTATDNVTAERELLSALEAAKGLPVSGPELGLTLSDLGGLSLASGNNKQADKYFSSALDSFRAAHGTEHANVAQALYNLGSARLRLRDLASAYDLFWESIRMQSKVFASDDVRQAPPFQSLAMLEISRERFYSARSHFRVALSRYRTATGSDSTAFRAAVEQTTFVYDQMIADILRGSGDRDPREALLREHKASILAYYGDPKLAVMAAQEAVEASSVLYGDEAAVLVRPLIDLGQAARRADDFNRAIVAFRRAVDLTKEGCSNYPRAQLVPLGQLSRVQAESGRAEEALESAKELVDLARRTYGEKHGRLRKHIELLAATLRENGLESEASAIEMQLPPSDHLAADLTYETGLDKRARRAKAREAVYPAAAC